ncbi:MAG: 30S ribosomal protein S1 [Pseudomonadota bacterium]|jgi:small subunit ribosomal protein S1|nr:30S ribosomal protein S1 [Syntrophaceae bacterium]MDI9554733.1 30S ribosomal protein S1 [Pseudomonadota bacterium]NLX30696.1 30S ribosomal protein S1 [Deltaproteobacteria bacterium]HOT48382.1 30S ribosomal protein S1 [Syntrophales bacterium]HPK18501.1 30S ribosomal protein S1 [Syntrophales bacterium]
MMEEEKSFAELLEASERKPVRLRQGQSVEAVIAKITSDWVFIDLGGKTEGIVERNEFLDKEGQLTVKEGDTVKVYFLSSRHGERVFTTRVSGDAARQYLEEAWRNAIPVEGIVEKEVKGGLEVRIAGTYRAFCPFSQAGIPRGETAAALMGQRIPFIIIEYGERGRRLVVSRRRILEEEERKRKEAIKETLREGMVVTGTVKSLRDFGAFVDIGGIEALLPVSEVGWGRVEDIRDRFTVGQTLEALVLGIDWARDRITLSVKGTLPDPWENVETRYPDGSRHRGTVARLADFGAFITLEPGVDGLIPISRLARGKKIRHPREVLVQGDPIEVVVESSDRAKRRLSLSPVLPEEEQEDSFRPFLQQRGARGFGSLGDMMNRKSPKGKKD